MAQPVMLALPDISPALAVEILPKGLVVNRLLVNADGKTHDLVAGPHNPTDHGRHPHKYQNSVIGRYANRIPVIPHTVSRNGASITFQPLPNENPRSSLHGGPEGFDVRDWTPIDLTAAILFSDKEKADIAALPSSAMFCLLSPDGDQGYPGTLLVEALFALSLGTPGPVALPAHVGSLYVVYRAKLQDTTNIVTPVNITQHWGFNLEASYAEQGAPTPTIADHVLSMKADYTLALDDDALPTGALVPAASGAQRLHRFLPPSGSGIDAFHIFNTPPHRTPKRLPLTTLSTLNMIHDILISPARASPLVELASPRSGLTLAFHSNQSGVQLYTANFYNGEGTRKRIHGWSGRHDDGYGPHTFAFLEFHEPLAAWLHPVTAPAGDTLLASGELYNSFVCVDVLFEKPISGDGNGEVDR